MTKEMAMTQKIRFARTLSFMPLIILFFFITPLAILLNPEVIPRFLGKTSEISQYGYLDVEHYLDIAENYDKEAWRTAFYPLWPKCLKLFNHFSPFDKYRTAIFVSSFLGMISLLFGKYIFSQISKNKSSSTISWSLYVLSPMSIFLFNGYSESLFALESWILIGLILNILRTTNNNNASYQIKYSLILIICVALGLTRPSLVQATFSSIIALFLSLKAKQSIHKIYVKEYLKISTMITFGFLIGYCIYGAICMNDGFRFFEPFYAQQLWGKSFGIRPIYLLTARSELINFWGLYFPFILIVNSLSQVPITGFKLNALNNVLFSNLPLTLTYPPAGIIYGLYSLRSKSKRMDKDVQSSNYLEKDYFNSLSFLFWYSSFFAFSHSLICFLTSELYLASLARFIFGQPYFYVSLSILINSDLYKGIQRPKTVYILTILLSSLMLLKNIIDFGNAKLHV